MSFSDCNLRILRALPALFFAAVLFAPPAAALGGYAKCGDIVQGVTCPRLFLDDDGALWLLDDFAGFQVGDRVFVTGTADPGCLNICQQGNGCIFNNTISACDLGTEYCFCGAGAPCGNPDPAGGCRNSTGSGGRLAANGSASVMADDLFLTASQVPANQSGIVFMGPVQTQVVFGDGLRCVGGGALGLFRFPVRNAGPGGSFSEGPIVGHSHANFSPSGQIQPGDTWNFQSWFRDPGGPCGSTFNLSHGLSISFTP